MENPIFVQLGWPHVHWGLMIYVCTAQKLATRTIKGECRILCAELSLSHMYPTIPCSTQIIELAYCSILVTLSTCLPLSESSILSSAEFHSRSRTCMLCVIEVTKCQTWLYQSNIYVVIPCHDARPETVAFNSRCSVLSLD